MSTQLIDTDRRSLPSGRLCKSNPPGLTETDLRILQFEKRWWRQAGAKDAEVRNQFGVSVTRYYQRLNRLLDNPAALATEPAVVKRLRSARDQP